MKSIFDILPQINADTAEEMAKQAGLDFTAVKAEIRYDYIPQFIKNKHTDKTEQEIYKYLREHIDELENTIHTVPDMVAVIRKDDGRYLGTVGRTRGILQYRDVLEFTESLVTKGEAAYVTGGIIGNGEQAFVVMKTGKAFTLSGTDKVECYFYVTTSHNNTAALEIVPSPLRNTNGTVLTMPKSARIKFRHSSRVEERVKRAAASLDRVNDYFDEMEESFRLLRSVNIGTSQLDTYLKMMVPDSKDRPKRAENVRDEIQSIYNTGPACRLPSTKGTMLGALFATVEWVDKIRGVKESKVRPNEHDAKLHSLLEGTGASQKAEAYAFALDMMHQLKNVKLSGSQV